jgi:hypothetical protein
MYDSKNLLLKNKKNEILIHLVENGTLVNIPSIETEDEFWDVIRIFQNGILAGVDLFISTPPSLPPIGNESRCFIILKIIEFSFLLLKIKQNNHQYPVILSNEKV